MDCLGCTNPCPMHCLVLHVAREEGGLRDSAFILRTGSARLVNGNRNCHQTTPAQVVSRVVQCLSGMCTSLQTGVSLVQIPYFKFVVALFWPWARLPTARKSATRSIKAQTHKNTHIQRSPAQE